jgi:hypothetical protein
VTQTSKYARRALVAGLGSVLALGARPAVAQTRFEWPDTTVQVSEYATVEQCLAVLARAKRDVLRRDALTVWRDTLPRDPRQRLEPLPEPVVEPARRCAARFTEPTTDLADFVPLLTLYLAAGRDSDATGLVARRLAAVPAKHARERVAVSDSALDIYLSAQPVRLDAAEQILVGRARDGSDRLDRIKIYGRLISLAYGVGDTVRARRAARWAVAVADSLTKAERESDKFETLGGTGGGKRILFSAARVLTGFPVILDSLRRGTPALAALERSMWAAVTRERPDAFPVPVGKQAPAITAEYWIPAEAARTPHPTPGRVTLVQFLDHDGCLGYTRSGDVGGICAMRLSALRRLGERYPALEITIVSRTRGFFLYAPPPSPAEEVEHIREWFAPYRIPRVTVAVASTPFWNLPRPDARRIDKDVPVFQRYRFAKTWKPEGQAFLVDQDGLVVSALGFNESQLGQFIEVLLHRQQEGDGHAAK